MVTPRPKNGEIKSNGINVESDERVLIFRHCPVGFVICAEAQAKSSLREPG
jgi:hypothetical protein